MIIPTQLFIGDKWVFEHTEANTSLNLKLNIVSPQYSTIINGTYLNGKYIFNAASALTANFIAGTYVISLTQHDGAERTTIESGHTVKIQADPTSTATFSYAQRMVNALEALLEGRVTNSQAMYSSLSFEGRSLTQLSPSEIHKALKIYREELKAEQHANDLSKGFAGKSNIIKVVLR